MYETLLCTYTRNMMLGNMPNDEDRGADRDRACGYLGNQSRRSFVRIAE